MNAEKDAGRAASPLLHGSIVGFGVPFLIVSLPLVSGRLEPLLTGLRVYALLPVFVICGGIAALSAWYLYSAYQRMGRRVTGFPLGCLIGGCVLGAALLWSATGDRPWPNRLALSAFGAPLLVGFWQWSGALLGLAARQQREEHRGDEAGPDP